MAKTLSRTSPLERKNLFSSLPAHPFRFVASTGFSIVELVVILVIVAILAAFALPNLSEWQANTKVKAVARDVVIHLQLAKMEAIKANERAVALFTAGAYSPAGQVGSYTIFLDTNQNFAQDAGEQVIIQQGMPPGISLITAVFADFAGLGTPAAANGFRPRGLPLSSADGVASAGVSIRNNKSRFYRILVSPAGNIRLQMSTDGASWQ